MQKNFKILLLILSLYMPISALECKYEIFVPAYNRIADMQKLLDKSSVTAKVLETLQSVKVSKKNYNQEMKILVERAAMLHEKEQYAQEAEKINETSIKTWRALVQSCQGEDAAAAQKVTNDVVHFKEMITKRLATIKHYIELVQLAMKVGEQRYAPDVKRE